MRAAAVACANVALSKYWGKRPGRFNVPAVPSLSVTLDGLSTTTCVAFDETLVADELWFDGVAAADEPTRRASELLDRVRDAASVSARARVDTHNDFPTASGLASSASGFAALALAALTAAGRDASREEVSRVARRSSASAARSVFGGFVELPGGLGPDATDEQADEACVARQVASAAALPLRMLVCVTTEGEKAVGSTSGMRETSERSPYYGAWLDVAPRLHAEMMSALERADLPALGELAERSALAMHASALAAGVAYVSGVTLSLLGAVQALRRGGTGVWATMDAGPHLKAIVDAKDADAVASELGAMPGVLRVIHAKPGPVARVLPFDEAIAVARGGLS